MGHGGTFGKYHLNLTRSGISYLREMKRKNISVRKNYMCTGMDKISSLG